MTAAPLIPMGLGPLVVAKQQLRARVKQRLSSLSQEAIQSQSRAIFEAIQNFQPYRDAARIAIFLSMPAGEVQTDAIVRHALSRGKQVFVPYLHRPSSPPPHKDLLDAVAAPVSEPLPARVMDMVSLSGVGDYENLRPDRWGIPSVDPATVDARSRVLAGASELDLVLVPGVAFDLDSAGRIRRLGHGKGFYDRFLNRYLAKFHDPPPAAGDRPPPLLCGLALTQQLLDPASGEQVPVDLHDRHLHSLILGSGELRESSSSRTAKS